MLVRGARRFSPLNRACIASLKPFHPALAFFCDSSVVESANEPSSWSQVDLERKMREIGLQVRPGFASAEEQAALASELEGVWKKAKYEKGHWDGVIVGYRETERVHWKNPANESVIARMRSLFPAGWGFQPAHVLDLEAKGEILPHVDAVATVGDVVCGLSLLSSCVMTFADEDQDEVFNVLLHPGTLYIMAGESRFRFKHSIEHKHQVFKGQPVVRGRRISVMIRDFPPNSPFKSMGFKN